MTDHDPMTDDERVLVEHRWAVRVNLPTDARHAAQVARRLLDVAAYARIEVPGEFTRAVELLERLALAISRQVEQERAQRVLSGMDPARFQRELERASLRRLHDAPGSNQEQVPDEDDDQPTEG